MSTSGIVLLVLAFGWIIYLFLYLFNSRCLKIEQTLKIFGYFLFTVSMCLIFTIIYSAYNTLFHYTLLTPTDTVNTVIGIMLSIAFLLVVVAIWTISFLTTPPISKQDQTIYVDKENIFDVESKTDKKT